MEVEEIGSRIFIELARQFPVCLASDEFHSFPQFRNPDHDWSKWDDFSPAGINRITRKIDAWLEELDLLAANEKSVDNLIDIAMLGRIISTILDELLVVRYHQTQPTLYLTIAGIGLAEALELNSAFFSSRLQKLPDFLAGAEKNLQDVPTLYRDLGLEMAAETTAWLKSLQVPGLDLTPALSSLDSFTEVLSQQRVKEDFLLSRDLLERVVSIHLGCQMDLEKISIELDREIAATQTIMKQESIQLTGNSSWPKAVESISLPDISAGGQADLYGRAVAELGQHCADRHLVGPDIYKSCPVRVSPVPGYLQGIRTASAYSMPPVHPPGGGTFYILAADISQGRGENAARDYRLLTAHETYPGHHLLDSYRWNNRRRIRRHVEFPLFYEGWACFAEELMFHTGFFHTAADKLLLARRRYWRAVRGKADLGIQTGRMDIDTAAALLSKSGIGRKQALSAVRRYALKPGYQLCYTLGMKRFRKLYKQFKGAPADFTQQIMSLGEIGLDNLERILLNNN